MTFKTMQFCYPWRSYQQRVIEAVQEHLSDKRLHVVAAPGAGKTTLGLEIFRLLEKPALVLSPTRVIRDQWIDRLRDFCDVEDPRNLDWVSTSIQETGLLTSITYQALHAKFKDELDSEVLEEEFLEGDEGLTNAELNSFIKTLEENNIQVLILDEAHHLRSEWWRALDKVCEHFPEMILVSLTATPPYDSQGHEWSRYEQLCGTIDEEISVPELVKAGTLCAHQDFIWACNASADEKKQIEQYDKKVSTVCQTLFNSEEVADIVLSHPWLHSEEIAQQVIREPEIAIALLSFIKARELAVNKKLMQLLDLSHDVIPELGRHWWQVLVEAVLFSNTFAHSDEQQSFVDQLKRQLKAAELLNKRELSLERSRRTERSLSLSVEKIHSCASIHRLEFKHRGYKLRQVVLTDYIRDEALKTGLNTGSVNLGAWPVFASIVSTSRISQNVGLLTGRLCIIATEKLAILHDYIDSEKIRAVPLEQDNRYQKVSGPLNLLTGAFTALLMDGHLNVLVGTRSLLGEGWDAPAVNSLILASSVGSFMLTNQMRGRAIRINPGEPDKVSSIWHLVAVNAKSYSGWSDYFNLRRRFDTFVGLSEKAIVIESGFERMDADGIRPKMLRNESAHISANNRTMLRRYKRLDEIRDRWKSALALDESARVIPSIKTNKVPRLRGLLLKHSLRYLLVQLGMILGAILFSAMHMNPHVGSDVFLYLLIAIAVALIYNLPKTYSVVKIALLYLPVDGALKQIGKALMEAMCQAGFIETSFKRMQINVNKFGDGSFYLSLSGCTFYESSLFADCLSEILAPIDNPRYLVLRIGRLLGTDREDYHAVPIKFGVKKELATLFYKSWNKNVCLSDLIYTRTPEGRQQLLKAKMKAFSSNFSKQVKRQDRWQ